MSKEMKILPALRFLEFENEGEWKTDSLGNLVEIKGRIGYRGYTRADIVEEGKGAITLSPSNFEDSGSLNFEKCTYITWEKYEESPEIMLEEGQTVLVKTASVGKSAYVKELPEKATINPQIVVLKPQKIEPKFLAYSIFHNYVQVQIKGAVGAGAIPNMSQDSISKFDILLPPDKKGIEQQKIAACLSSLDELIAAHNDKLDALKDHKKGLLQNLFPQEGETVPKVRFPEFEDDGEWVEDKLSNCADVVDPHPSHRAPIAVSDGIPFIGIGDISEQGELNLKNVRLVPREILDEHRERYRLKIGDFAYGRVASVGKVVDLSKNIDKDYTYSPTMAIVRPKRINASFLRHLCNSSSFITQVIAKTSGSTRKSIGMQNLRILNISMPSSLKEQHKIASCLSAVDELISAQQDKIDALQQNKMGLIKSLFATMTD